MVTLVLALSGYVLYHSYQLTARRKQQWYEEGRGRSAQIEHAEKVKDTGVPAEFRGDWSRVDAARKGLDSPARPAAEPGAAALKDLEALLANSDAAKGLTQAAKTALAQEMLSAMAGIKDGLQARSGPGTIEKGAAAEGAPSAAVNKRAETTAVLAADASQAAGVGTPSGPAPSSPTRAASDFRAGSRRGGARVTTESRKLVLPPSWLTVKAMQVHSFERPTATTGPVAES